MQHCEPTTGLTGGHLYVVLSHSQCYLFLAEDREIENVLGMCKYASLGGFRKGTRQGFIVEFDDGDSMGACVYVPVMIGTCVD